MEEDAIRDARERAIKKHPAAELLLKDVEVIIPEKMTEAMRFIIGEVSYRRDHELFVDLITAVGYLRQVQKEVKTHMFEFNGVMNHMEYVECDAEDYEAAYRVFCGYMKSDPKFKKHEDLNEITTPEEMKDRLSVLQEVVSKARPRMANAPDVLQEVVSKGRTGGQTARRLGNKT